MWYNSWNPLRKKLPKECPSPASPPLLYFNFNRFFLFVLRKKFRFLERGSPLDIFQVTLNVRKKKKSERVDRSQCLAMTAEAFTKILQQQHNRTLKR